MIYNVTYDDDGEYTCNVGSGEGSSPVIMLNILARVEGMLHSTIGNLDISPLTDLTE